MIKNSRKGKLKMMSSTSSIFTMTKLLIGLVLFSLFVAVLGGAYYSMATEYGVPTSDKYSAYNKLGAISNKTTSIGDQFQGGKLSQTQTNTFIIAAQSTFAGFQIMLNAISIPIEIINQISSDVSFIPKIFIYSLFILLSLAVAYAIGSAFARWWV